MKLWVRITKIILEGDALEIVQALRKEGDAWGLYRQVLNDTKYLLQRFQEHCVNHVGREANGAAHNLAKLALSLGEDKV